MASGGPHGNAMLRKAKSAKRESKSVEFKAQLNLESARDWVEIVKDIVAMANSGGGAITFGLKNDGSPSGFDVTALLNLDPAQLTDKVAKYTGEQFSDFSVEELKRDGSELAVFLIFPVSVPIVFNREGDYFAEGGEHKFAFRKGAVYFRHGAKSEPATTNDLREAIERELERIRTSWIGGIRKVVEAPKGSQIQVVSPESVRLATQVRLTEGGEGIAVQTLNPDQTHPYRQKETLELVNKRVKGPRQVNSYDILCVRRVHNVDAKPLYYWEPKFGSPQYSDAFVDWVVAEYEKDPAFFDTCRDKFKSV